MLTTYGSPEKGKIEIYNELGQKIMQLPINQNNTKIDLTNFDSGLYSLKVKTQQDINVLKLIKN